ncbi:transcriptional regulator [Enterococcus florum]|uniref:Transcriptional regulator n=1 Tax=Enterococcus florum TaxID=2480627 RepID=A0A4P5P3Y5_9ENTE|nr:helix-turn-helix transcriptional regulator [Enterococcus florum]GCF92467.1 transcriptional regulator [Enterococcus florum]
MNSYTYSVNLELIKKRRIELGLSQSKVAEYLGITNDKYSKRENGEHKFKSEELPALSKVLSIPLDIFFVKNLR